MERERISYQPNANAEAKLAYNPSFDERDYANFSFLSENDQGRLRDYTKRQLETYVGERVQVAESVTRYEIIDGKIFSTQANETLEEMVARGINFRREHGNPIDFKREDAELTGIKKIQRDLTIGTTYLVVSSPGGEGSDYTNNFFDTFSVKQDQSGEFIEHRRFLSNLTNDEYVQRVTPFKKFDKYPTAEDFLSDPIKINEFDDASEIQKYLSGGVRALEKEELEKINKINASLITSYINSLVNSPNDHFVHRLKYNAILNQTDLVLDAIKMGDFEFLDKLSLGYSFNSNYAEDMSWVLGSKQVRQTEGPCPGTSGGFNLGGFVEQAKGAFSVMDFGKSKDRYGDRTFECPHCGKENLRPENKLIENCQNCGKDVRC